MHKRIVWVDMAKCIAIIFVMIGHAPGTPKLLNNWIYLFHMPLFFFLSGYVFSKDKYTNLKEIVISKSRTLLLPMVCFGMINIIWNFILTPEQGINTVIKQMIGFLVELRGGVFDSGLWFITCLFIVEIIYFIFIKISNDNNKKVIILLVLSSIIGFLYVRLINHVVPWAIEESLIAVGFFGFGNLFRHNILFYTIKENISLYFFISIFISFIVTFINIHINVSVDMYTNSLGIYPLFYLGAFSGIIFSITLSMMLGNSKILIFIGKNSFIYYAFHKNCYRTFQIIQSLMGLIINNSFIWIIYVFISCIIIAIFSILIDKYFPWIFKKSKI